MCVKLSRLHIRMIIVALAVGIALAAWVHGQGGRPACKPERTEKRDPAGKVIEITTRTCLEHKD
jgi:hypothetical protein